MRQLRRTVGAVLLGATALAATPRSSAAHPLHTTFVELKFTPQNGTVTATVKVFADDFLKRVTRGTTTKPGDQVALQKLSVGYLSQTLIMKAASGEAVQWRFCGWKRSADLIFICLTGTAKRGLPGLRIRDAILTDVFPDQVNIFQVEYGGQRHSLLFMSGGGVKQLP